MNVYSPKQLQAETSYGMAEAADGRVEWQVGDGLAEAVTDQTSQNTTVTAVARLYFFYFIYVIKFTVVSETIL